MKYTVRLIEVGCIFSHEMFDVVWHAYVSSMYIAYQYVKICMDLLAKLAKRVRTFSDFIADGINSDCLFSSAMSQLVKEHTFFAMAIPTEPMWVWGVYHK